MVAATPGDSASVLHCTFEAHDETSARAALRGDRRAHFVRLDHSALSRRSLLALAPAPALALISGAEARTCTVHAAPRRATRMPRSAPNEPTGTSYTRRIPGRAKEKRASVLVPPPRGGTASSFKPSPKGTRSTTTFATTSSRGTGRPCTRLRTRCASSPLRARFAATRLARRREGECSFMYRYILRESCSQFDSLPLTYLTIPPTRLVSPHEQRCRTRGPRGCGRGRRGLRFR